MTLEAGIAFLRDGRAQEARGHFQQLLAGDPQNFALHLGLAYACVTLADADGALQAVERALAREPRDLRALMLKADLLEQRGDLLAASFYEAALKVAGDAPALPAELQALRTRAQAAVQRHSLAFEQSLQGHLRVASAQAGPPSARFAQSLDLLAGRRELFLQSPTLYYFPELPQIQFFDRAAFPWLDTLEAATADIRAELLALMRQRGGFEPYLRSDASRPMLNKNELVDNPAWGAFYLWKDGALVADSAARCPRTVEALSRLPLVHIARRSPNVLFSLLLPGAHIPPHNGFVNTRLIGHLPLIVPPGCSLRVGNETREWVEGRAWLFDDTIEHEAWNRSNELRVVLLFEVWRPELSESERAHVTALFASIEATRGEIAGWGI